MAGLVFSAGVLACQIVLVTWIGRAQTHRSAGTPDHAAHPFAHVYFVGFLLGASAMLLIWFGGMTIVDGYPAIGTPVATVGTAIAVGATLVALYVRLVQDGAHTSQP